MRIYHFKAFVPDHSATATFTFFTPNANILIGECSQLMKMHNTPQPHDLPPQILALKVKRHIFQFHYNPRCNAGRVDFIFNDILDKRTNQSFQTEYISESGKQLAGTFTPGSQRYIETNLQHKEAVKAGTLTRQSPQSTETNLQLKEAIDGKKDTRLRAVLTNVNPRVEFAKKLSRLVGL
ncbi:hypothetical protein Tco_1402752 [Tanacetum coccineum]